MMTNEDIIAYYNNSGAMSSIVDLLNLARIDQQNKTNELIKALKEYSNLLAYELDDVVGIASIHGWQSSRVNEGLLIREKIKTLELDAVIITTEHTNDIYHSHAKIT